LQKIQTVIADLNQNLPVLLQAAHVSNATLAARVTAAVNLILTTVSSFAALIPQPTPTTAPATARKLNVSLPHANDLKRQWNQQVCSASGNAAFDQALANCMLR
jgi:hypothetical protein